jgi:NADP-dependent 3-hydroxy acid dehydrogenase YdfG
MQPLAEFPLVDWNAPFDINVKGVMLALRAVPLSSI